jgi:acyl-CoA synthetase (AMP-forming)/AMP-acid ligase II
MNIVDPILFQCRQQPPAAAICAPGAGISLISYRRLEYFIHNISRRLLSYGLAPGSIAAVSIDDVIFHAAMVLALTRLGIATISMRKNSIPPIKVDAFISDAPLGFRSGDRAIQSDMSWTEGSDEPIESHYLPEISPDSICRLIPTSGTTGTPKAVAISHRLLIDRMSRHGTVFGRRLANCARIYSDAPISTSLGFQFLIYTLWRGGTLFLPGDSFENTLQAFEQYKVQAMVAPPSGLEVLWRWYDRFPEYQSNMETIICGGDKLPPSLSERVRARICPHVIAAYGSTEASMSATATAHALNQSSDAVGFVAPGVTVQVVAEADTILPPNTEGQIRIRSEFSVAGYFNAPEETALSFRNGWFYPGDIGTLSSDQLLVITGREKTMLNLGGDKIAPETVERVLSTCEGVVESAVCSLPNQLGINEVYALVVGPAALDLAKIKAHCATQLLPQFIPTHFIAADHLPRNEMGKVDRHHLPEIAKQAVARHQ